MSRFYIDEDGKEHEHHADLQCYWCGEQNGRLYQRYRSSDSAPLNIDVHGVLCTQCLLDERTQHAERWRQAMMTDAEHVRAEKARQRNSDAAEGFPEWPTA